MPASPLVAPGRAANLDDASLDKLDLANSIPFLLAHAVAFAAPFVSTNTAP